MDSKMSTDVSEKVKEQVREKRAQEPVRRFAHRPAATAIMQVLVDAGGEDLGVSTVSDSAGISRQTFYDCEEMLVELGLIEQTRRENGGALYRARMASDEVTAWQTFRAALRPSTRE